MKENNIASALQKMGRQAGLGLHFSSLPGGHGIGDIADCALAFFKPLAEMGIGVWQFLPTGPTAYGDSPYQPLSAFAGNPLLIGLNPLLRLGLIDARDLDAMRILPPDYVNYGRLIPLKKALLEKAASRFHERADQRLKVEYEEFLHHQAGHWLDDYALFRLLKGLHGERAWPEWDKEYVYRLPSALKQIEARHRDTLELTRLQQFLFWNQWQQLKSAAAEKGICLFGDMPIYVALDSSDAWAHPEILRIDEDGQPSHVAGVPPDYFSKEGQLWGNPLYDWAYHKQTGYRWWIERMQHAADQNGLIRIDHFRGFESFWSVPNNSKTAKSGEWVAGPGDALFDAMRQSLGSLPIVAEDLGVITPEVDELRLKHGFPGMEVLQFEIGDVGFNIDTIKQNSVCYTGTHDNDTAVGWFLGTGTDTRSKKQVKDDQAAALVHTGGSKETIHTDMIRLAFSSPAALAVAPMQDFLGLGSEARLNTPGTTVNNWRWRLGASQLTPEAIESGRKLVEESSRAPD